MSKEDIIISEIMDSAKKLFQQYGLHKTTMEDIARAAGKGKSTLYYYLKSKDEIFDKVVLEEMGDLFDSVKDKVDQEENVHDKLKTFMIVKIKSLREKVNLYRLTLETYNALELDDHFRKLRDQFDLAEVNLLTTILEQGIVNGSFKSIKEEEIAIVAEVMVAGIRGIEMEIVSKDRFKNLESKIDIIVGILINGLR